MRAPSSSKIAALREYAPAILAGLVTSQGEWWRIGEDGIRRLAVLSCDVAEALHDEIERRAEAEARVGRQPGMPGFEPE